MTSSNEGRRGKEVSKVGRSQIQLFYCLFGIFFWVGSNLWKKRRFNVFTSKPGLGGMYGDHGGGHSYWLPPEYDGVCRNIFLWMCRIWAVRKNPSCLVFVLGDSSTLGIPLVVTTMISPSLKISDSEPRKAVWGGLRHPLRFLGENVLLKMVGEDGVDCVHHIASYLGAMQWQFSTYR